MTDWEYIFHALITGVMTIAVVLGVIVAMALFGRDAEDFSVMIAVIALYYALLACREKQRGAP